ncbi:uncharacterized protein LOC128222363 [Mya arenaria]|uniref:uncharacterized protein LOC128222363 n=1 Tax=Mya arenaria TaxID=6604 RepID=UPI0022DF8B92|nr:uncharacterized protein LOC128222363 [Mya arenaria]
MAYFYQVPALVNLCSQYLQSIAREDNVCEILDLALQYDNVGLRQAACDYIDQNATIIIETDSFVHVSKLCLEYILKADTFHVDEKTILRRAIEWAKLYQGNDSLNMDEDIRFNITVKHFRNTIGNAFQYIRLGAMSFAEFSECAGSTLDAEEIKDILLFTNICSTDEFHQNRLPKKKILELKNGISSWTAHSFSRSSESMYKITVKKNLICEGIKFSKLSLSATWGNPGYGEPNLDFSVNITIEITRTGLNFSFKTAMQALSLHTIKFESPVNLKASKDPYTLVVKIEFQPNPLNITINANQAGVGSATVEHAEVEWNNQFSILHQIHFSNMSNRELKDKERKCGDERLI